MRKFWLLAIMATSLFLGAATVEAAPRFTLSPSSGNYTNGGTFSVTIGVDSDTEKAIAMDVVANFDASKLEVTSITKAANPVFQFAYDSNTAIIKNDTGRFEVTLSPISSSVYDGAVMKGDLLVINFRAKATGTASLTFNCQAGSVTETNIINDKSSDVVSCSANQSGSYTIGAADSGSLTTSTSTPTPTAASQLPRTGVVENTVILVVLGVVGMIGALVFAKI